MAEKVLYVGEPTLTRGQYGEQVISGRLQDGEVLVWDSTLGWSSWGNLSADWKRTGEQIEDIPADAPRY